MKKSNNLFLPAGYEISKANFSDAEGISIVHVNTWKTSYGGIVDQGFLDSLKPEDRLEFRKNILIDNKGIYFVVVYKSQIVGFCDAGSIIFHENRLLSEEKWKQYEGFGEIYAIYVLKDHQNKGIGHALFQKARIKLNEKGLIPYLVWVIEENKQACQFYEKEGGIKMDEAIIKIANKNHKGIAYKFER